MLSVTSDDAPQTASVTPVLDGTSTRLDHIEGILSQLNRKLSSLDVDGELVAATNSLHNRFRPPVQHFNCLKYDHVAREC